MKRFTKEYVQYYNAQSKTKEELRSDLRICSNIIRTWDNINPDAEDRLFSVGRMATEELFRRYGDFALWSAKYVNNLPDSAFAWIEAGGKKDADGKTTPRTLRHLPYKDADGKVDLPHLRNALARISQVQAMPEAERDKTQKMLEALLSSTKKDMEESFTHEEFGVQRLFGHPAGQMFQVAKLKKYMTPHKVFCEPFAGSATLFFAKEPSEERAYLNDMGFYSTLLKMIKSLTDAEINQLTKRNWVSTEAYFNKMRNLKPSTKVDFIHKHIYLARWAYGGSIHLNWNSHHNGKSTTHNNPQRWSRVRDRLQKATITKMDYAEVIRKVDGPDTFFYIDPPYYTEKDKRIRKFNIGQIKVDDFVKVLKGIKGKFISTIGNEKEWLDKLRDAGFYIYMSKSHAGTPPQKAQTQKKSLVVPFISNYPLTERQNENERIDESEVVEAGKAPEPPAEKKEESHQEYVLYQCPNCTCTRQTSSTTPDIVCQNCGGMMKRVNETHSTNFTKDDTKSERIEVHSVDFIGTSFDNPQWLELTGILFHRGWHKGIYYSDDVLKSARLVPRGGENLCYANFYHKKDESHRVGLMAEIWWDPKVAWYCPNNDEHGKGALMYRSFVTEKDAISEIRSGKIGNVSAELHFDTYRKANDQTMKEYAAHVEVNGQAITSSPALKAADIENVCTLDESGNRSCTKVKNAQMK